MQMAPQFRWGERVLVPLTASVHVSPCGYGLVWVVCHQYIIIIVLLSNNRSTLLLLLILHVLVTDGKINTHGVIVVLYASYFFSFNSFTFKPINGIVQCGMLVSWKAIDEFVWDMMFTYMYIVVQKPFLSLSLSLSLSPLDHGIPN